MGEPCDDRKYLELMVRHPAHRLKKGVLPELFKALTGLGCKNPDISPFGDFSTISTDIVYEDFKVHLSDSLATLTNSN